MSQYGKSPPRFIEPQLSLRVEKPPQGDGWCHELKFDGYRLHARVTQSGVRLLTRHGLNWADRYKAIASAFANVKHAAYVDGEICALRADGTSSFADLQAATDKRTTDELVYCAFDLLFLDGRDLTPEPLHQRKERLRDLLANAPSNIRYAEHVVGNGPAFYRAACQHKVEGIVSKRLDAPYRSMDRGLWTKTKCVNIEESSWSVSPIPKARGLISARSWSATTTERDSFTMRAAAALGWASAS